MRSTASAWPNVIDRAPGLGSRAAYLSQVIRDKLIEHALYIGQHGEDLPEIRECKWAGDATKSLP